MAHFQDNRFLGLSGRTLMVTVVIALAVGGLFFIPETLKVMLKSSGKVGEKRAALDSRARKDSRNEERGALSPDILKSISSKVGASSTPPANQNTQTSKRDSLDDGERKSLFSGWDFKVKAYDQKGSSVKVPASMSLDKIGTKEFQGMLKQSQNDLRMFIKKSVGKNADGEAVVMTFMDQLELASRETAKGISSDELLNGLQELHVSTIQSMSRAGLDRGVILEWLKLPIVAFVDDRVGLHAQEKVRAHFAPRLKLKSVNVRQPRSSGWGMDGRTPPMARVELGFQGSDIEKVVVFANGRKLSEASGPRSASEINRVVRVNGEAHGVWTFVAYDRFGGKQFWKSYSFYPRVRRFRQTRNGEFVIAFKANSAPNSLDRFFMVGSSALRQSGDPMISTF